MKRRPRPTSPPAKLARAVSGSRTHLLRALEDHPTLRTPPALILIQIVPAPLAMPRRYPPPVANPHQGRRHRNDQQWQPERDADLPESHRPASIKVRPCESQLVSPKPRVEPVIRAPR